MKLKQEKKINYYIICENTITDEEFIIDECPSRKMARLICDELDKKNSTHVKYRIMSDYFEVKR